MMQGVLEHVRLMEIGSEVFAQEVEPTGLLSMEMTLARSENNLSVYIPTLMCILELPQCIVV